MELEPLYKGTSRTFDIALYMLVQGTNVLLWERTNALIREELFVQMVLDRVAALLDSVLSV